MYKTKYFILQELVPQHVFKDRGEQGWYLLQETALITLDQLREEFGSCTVNNWHTGGNFNWSGLRTWQYYWDQKLRQMKTSYSQHIYGGAFDCKYAHATAHEVREYVRANPDQFPYLNSFEEDVSWFHFDTRNCERIMTYSP